MSTTRVQRQIAASRAKVYAALIDGRAVRQWMVPDGMSSEVHHFDGREGGTFRISLTYQKADAVGKTSAHTDTHHGRFIELVPNERVVQSVEFETDDPSLQGEMTLRFELHEANGGTELRATHQGVPSGVPPADNALGWRMALDKLAALVETASVVAG